MADPLERLIRELRDETCPASVPDRVARRLAGRAAPSRSWRRWLAWGLAAAVVLVGILAVPNPTRRRDRGFATRSSTEADHVRVVHQTVGALAVVGHTLLRAADHAGNSLVRDAAPPLFKSYQTAKTKLTDNL